MGGRGFERQHHLLTSLSSATAEVASNSGGDNSACEAVIYDLCAAVEVEAAKQTPHARFESVEEETVLADTCAVLVATADRLRTVEVVQFFSLFPFRKEM